MQQFVASHIFQLIPTDSSLQSHVRIELEFSIYSARGSQMKNIKHNFPPRVYVSILRRIRFENSSIFRQSDFSLGGVNSLWKLKNFNYLAVDCPEETVQKTTYSIQPKYNWYNNRHRQIKMAKKGKNTIGVNFTITDKKKKRFVLTLFNNEMERYLISRIEKILITTVK